MTRDSSDIKQPFNRHLEEMERDGTWGTEQEIIAAANLFDISIITYNKYANNSYCLQHFSPHFAIHPDCRHWQEDRCLCSVRTEVRA